ncbi:DUF4352 domain-containing protein [Streptomyces sp. NPDC047972]|uniref:DUF4352 domain-containing protein n=1 Tax=Streptomyces sp. NPDC047972 TaxID=3365493 RepID=UPI00371274E0
MLVVGLAGVLIGAGVFGGDQHGGAAGDPLAPPPTNASPSGPSTLPQSSAPSAEPTSPASRTATGDGAAVAFGRTQGYGDGVEVTVSAPAPFAPSESAAGHTAGNQAVALEITVRNGGDRRLDLGTVSVQVRDAEGRDVAQVVDAEPPHRLLGLSGTLLPGRKAVAGYGFDVPADGSRTIDVEVRVGFASSALFWSGPVAS